GAELAERRTAQAVDERLRRGFEWHETAPLCCAPGAMTACMPWTVDAACPSRLWSEAEGRRCSIGPRNPSPTPTGGHAPIVAAQLRQVKVGILASMPSGDEGSLLVHGVARLAMANVRVVRPPIPSARVPRRHRRHAPGNRRGRRILLSLLGRS